MGIRGLGIALAMLTAWGPSPAASQTIEIVTRGTPPCPSGVDLHKQLRLHLEARRLRVQAAGAALRLEVGLGAGGRVSVRLRDQRRVLFLRSIQIRQEDCPALAETIALVVDSSFDQLPWRGELTDAGDRESDALAVADGGEAEAEPRELPAEVTASTDAGPADAKPDADRLVEIPPPAPPAVSRWMGEIALSGGASWGPAEALVGGEGEATLAAIRASGWGRIVAAWSSSGRWNQLSPGWAAR